MEITEKELALIDDWVELHQEIETLELELENLSQKLKKTNIRLYSKKQKVELEFELQSAQSQLREMVYRVEELTRDKGIVELELKFVPLAVSVNAGICDTFEVGKIDVNVGVGLQLSPLC